MCNYHNDEEVEVGGTKETKALTPPSKERECSEVDRHRR